MTRRWLVVLVAAAAFIATPLAVSARPAAGSSVSAMDLVQRMQASATLSWSGFVHSSGALQVPESASFANLVHLLGEDNDLRVWWRSPTDWRVDRIRSTGEADLFRNQNLSAQWTFESERATVSPVSKVRLPDASDLLPPTLARSLLQGARPQELTRLPSARLAGVDAPGVRLLSRDPATTVARVDLWADPRSGLPLRVQLYGVGDRRPVLTTTLQNLDLRMPAPRVTRFDPPEGVDVQYEQSVDVAAAANAFYPFAMPRSLAGLGTRGTDVPGAVGVYGRGPTTLIALPLRGQVAAPLRQRLESGGGRETSVGTVAPGGLVGLLVTPDRGDGGGFLLAGTVNAETLQRAATELLARA